MYYNTIILKKNNNIKKKIKKQTIMLNWHYKTNRHRSKSVYAKIKEKKKRVEIRFIESN